MVELNPITILKNLLRTKELQRVFGERYAEVKDLGRRQEYRLGVDRAYRVFEILTDEALDRQRPPDVTAREYVTQVCDEYRIDPDIYKEMYLNFELARYSKEEITFDMYSETLQAFDIILREIKAAGEKVVTTKRTASKGKKKRTRKGKRKAKARRKR